MAFTIANIVIGLVVGAAVMWFLIMPAVNESQARQMNESIVEASDQIASQESEISALEKELESYRTQSDEAQTAKENRGVHKEQLRVSDGYSDQIPQRLGVE